MKEQHILIFSHGQTVAQLNKVFSDANTVMTDQGRQEVLNDIKDVKSSDVKYKKIYCSGLPRAIDTAKILSKELAVPFEIIQELAQQDFGIYTGTPNTKENYENYIKDLLAENGKCESITSVLNNLKIAVNKQKILLLKNGIPLLFKIL
jgi:broad specificity phosphatase PhoE